MSLYVDQITSPTARKCSKRKVSSASLECKQRSQKRCDSFGEFYFQLQADFRISILSVKSVILEVWFPMCMSSRTEAFRAIEAISDSGA